MSLISEEVGARFRSKFMERARKEFQYDKKTVVTTSPATKQSIVSVQNIFWIIASIATVHYSDIAAILLYDERVNRFWLNIGVVLILINVTIASFLIVYLTYVKKLSSDEWDREYPAAIPVATAAFCAGAGCLTISLWPVWSILSPVILFVIFMGFVIVIAALPNI